MKLTRHKLAFQGLHISSVPPAVPPGTSCGREGVVWVVKLVLVGTEEERGERLYPGKPQQCGGGCGVVKGVVVRGGLVIVPCLIGLCVEHSTFGVQRSNWLQ